MKELPEGAITMLGYAMAAIFLTATGITDSPEVTLRSKDMALRVRPMKTGGMEITSLRGARSSKEWITQGKSQLRFVNSAVCGGKTVDLTWSLRSTQPDKTADGNEVTFVFESTPRLLEIRSRWRLTQHGPCEHILAVRNISAQTVSLHLQASLAMALRKAEHADAQIWWVEKGAYTPGEVGVHRVPAGEATQCKIASTPYCEDGKRDAIPWFAIQDGGTGIYGGIESTARVAANLMRPDPDAALNVDIGLDPDRETVYTTMLPAQASLNLPTCFFGVYSGTVDDGCNQLRRWVERYVRPATSDPQYPRLTVNSWGGGMAIDDHLARRMIDDANALGLEMFHIDAGWFRSVGDWMPNPSKFANGLRPISDYAHSKGLKFGLWVGWTQGGLGDDDKSPDRTLNVHNASRKGWFAQNHNSAWRPADFTGADLCLADNDASHWCIDLLRSIIKEYHLDLLEHDQRMIVERCNKSDHGHSQSRADISQRAAEGYYHVYDTLRAENPGLLFENCVNGGRMVDYGAVRRCHYISITDTYDPLSNRRAFYDATFALPAAMCECCIADTHPQTEAAFLTMLRSGMMGWCTVMCDTNAWTARQHQLATRQFDLYKQRLRPLILHGNLYHVTERPNNTRWDAIEYAAPDRRTGAVYAFRGNSTQPNASILLSGLDPSATYQLTYEDRANQDYTATGRELSSAGLRVHIGEVDGSEIVLINRK